jgi:hypothetical protein
MWLLDISPQKFSAPEGSLILTPEDEISLKLALLLEGECGPLGPDQAAAKFGFSRQRYFQLRHSFLEEGARGLLSQKRGPRSNYRRSQELVCQTIRHRFLDPEASTEAIAQKLRQCGFTISQRSVDRIIAQYGLQKKTLSVSSRPPARRDRNLSDPPKNSPRTRRSRQPGTRRPPTTGR